MLRSLGRIEPSDWKHLDKFPLTASTSPVKPVPGVLGVNWYREFDSPEKDRQGHWWIARSGRLTVLRGGHAICAPPARGREPYSWWDFYDQGSEGACVGFACSRMMSIYNRRRFDARWLYRYAQKIDEWPGEDYEGTSVRAGLETLRTVGHRAIKRNRMAGEPSPYWGITTYRWALSTQDFMAATGRSGGSYIELENSWGRSYPRRVRMPVEVLDRLLRENGEFGLATDR